MTQRNCDVDTIDTFSKQWVLFDQSELPDTELQEIFAQYFRDFPWGAVGEKAVGMDVGCGTGRWANYIAPRVGKLHCIDASSSAVELARAKLKQFRNCDFHVASIDDLPVPDASMDFACCIGVLHYIPNPATGLKALTTKLKTGAPLLLYVYYALDDRPLWFRAIWAVQDRMRRVIAAAPFSVRYVISQTIAAAVYYPLTRAARLADDLGMNVENIPLSAYRRRSFYTMRADSLNRFAHHMEHRFTRQAVLQIMEVAGLERVRISDGPVRWVAMGYKR